MDTKSKILLIDPDASSRTEMYRFLSSLGYYSEPIESLDDFFSYCYSPSIVLIHDKGDIVPEFARRLEDIGEWFPFAVYSEEFLTLQVVNAVRNGALDCFAFPGEKDSVAGRLAQLESIIAQSGHELSRSARAKRLVRELSFRQVQVLKCVSHGMSNKQIAQEYGISPRTVELHRKIMISKLGVSSSPEAVRLAVAAGIAA